ncbi:Avl9p KNAG_0G02330 [Huiozyma naganishii CBS 8797]|uniref:UDENN domain-containing protein n=1 Tax=Huiozyma naganishii (strain ATCC MYA-139 / BCRC 22969 / CBS 8797 / KCTC 17520 / NBRC 10181 / NCYC 3082 / Yp74L-3) TaxID=1071383 RepID=J7S939_HUIN7|nr:hypothetical protein KNAG_0G02330 [Kazachstania naganishii CBS 8797]CCK71291.1 hypothetical protein KNAG_0G02330 [Kazachstania naganishii CBS 8797]
MAEKQTIVGVCLVDFHHKRGPEVEYWYGLPDGTDETDLWKDLPFQALPDGSHSFEETFTFFTLLFNEKTKSSLPNDAASLPEDQLNDYTTFFAISCSRQIKSEDLIRKDKDVTRCTVQKAIVVVSRLPIFSQIKDKLNIVTNAFFLQHDFTDKTLINNLHQSLVSLYDSSSDLLADNNNFYVGLCLKRIIKDLKKEALVLLKAMLLEQKIIFYGNNVENLSNLQFGLVSLIPELLWNLQDCGSPQLTSNSAHSQIATSFQSADRKSVHRFLGFPLRIFEEGGFFSPYTPLQQLDVLRSDKSKFFVLGTSNSLLCEQKESLCDIFVNLDANRVEILNKSITQVLQLSTQDSKWIEGMAALVDETFDDNNEKSTKSFQYEGGEDWIRSQFEEYLTGLFCSVKLHDYITLNENNSDALQTISEDLLKTDPVHFFNMGWVKKWKETKNFRIFNTTTDDRIFDLFQAKHICNDVDPIAAFQQKFIATFRNMKKQRGPANLEEPSPKPYKTKSNDSRSSSALSKKSSNNDDPVSVKSGEEQQPVNVWNTWKDYFNKKKAKSSSNVSAITTDTEISDKNVTKKVDETDLSATTEDLKSIPSTKNAIQTALLGLGIHVSQEELKEFRDKRDTPVSIASSDDKRIVEANTNSNEDERTSNSNVNDRDSVLDVVNTYK